MKKKSSKKMDMCNKHNIWDQYLHGNGLIISNQKDANLNHDIRVVKNLTRTKQKASLLLVKIYSKQKFYILLMGIQIGLSSSALIYQALIYASLRITFRTSIILEKCVCTHLRRYSQ